jgi:hypothetical protein
MRLFRATNGKRESHEAGYWLAKLALVATPAAADSAPPAQRAAVKPPPLRLNPPEHYDHPYNGPLVVTVARDETHVRELCPSAKFTLGVALGCSVRHVTEGCWVVLAPEAVISAAGFPPELVKRHEIAHCNGWPADHRGARPFVDWAE